MKIKKIILNILLSILNCVVHLFPIKKKQVTFVSLESDKLEQDLLQIYEAIEGKYEIKKVLIKFKENTLWNSFLYMLNTCKQIWYINQSALVIINDNNYVVSNFKRKGVKVMQVWHATGAIKKFGNCLPREYKIKNYDYIIANSACWTTPYSEAFGVEEQQVQVVGMPRVDRLFGEKYQKQSQKLFYERFPELRDKKLLLYAPTFRGNIYKGFSTMDLDGTQLVEHLGTKYVLLYKYHPLLAHTKIVEHEQCVNVSGMDLYDLFHVSDLLISDYSSIIFDYSLLHKPMIFYAPDLEEYQGSVGHFVEYETMPGPICNTTEMVMDEVGRVLGGETLDEVELFSKRYFSFQDDQNTTRVVNLMEELILG